MRIMQVLLDHGANVNALPLREAPGHPNPLAQSQSFEQIFERCKPRLSSLGCTGGEGGLGGE